MFGWKTLGGVSRVAETSGAWDGVATRIGSGLVAGTRVATPNGWQSGRSDCPEDVWPLNVPAGALGNRKAMEILPDQTVMIESDTAEERFADPFVLIPALALEGFRGIERAYQREQGHVVTLQFEQDQIVFANIGALFFYPGAGDIMTGVFTSPSSYTYRSLTMKQADTLITCIEMEDKEAVFVPQHQAYEQRCAA